MKFEIQRWSKKLHILRRGEGTREPQEREGKGMMMMREDRRDDSGNWSVKDK